MEPHTLRRTPCVGICSTTYGDLVCRGCKRFAHEIDQWNGYQADQRALVWERLFGLRAGAFLAHAVVPEPELVLEQARLFNIPEIDKLDPVNLAYEVIRRAGRRSDFSALGIEPRQPAANASELYQRIEQELYARSVARYEHDFHVIAQ